MQSSDSGSGSSQRVGYAIGWILWLAGIQTVPACYVRAVHGFRRMRKMRSRYTRPIARRGSDVARALKRGLFHKVPLDLRLVPIEDDPWLHRRYAI